MKTNVIGIDIGTTGTKTGVYDSEGRLLGCRTFCRQVSPTVRRIALRDRPAKTHWRVGRSPREDNRRVFCLPINVPSLVAQLTA